MAVQRAGPAGEGPSGGCERVAGACYIDAERYDFREWLIAAGPLSYRLDRTGGDRVAAIEVAIGHASPANADYLRRFDGRDPDALRLTTWGLTEVEGEQGPCFLKRGFRATTSRSTWPRSRSKLQAPSRASPSA